MDLSQYAAGKRRYMSKSLWDEGKGETLTIAQIEETEFNQRDGSTVNKLVIKWVEDRPPLTLNKTNLNWIIATLGPRDADWQGKRVYAFHDPTVRYAGNAVGGVVLDAPPKPMTGPDPDLSPRARKMAEIAKAKGVSTEEPCDDIPF